MRCRGRHPGRSAVRRKGSTRLREACHAGMTEACTPGTIRSLTVRLPDQLVREIEAESRERNCAKSDVVRERLQRGARPASSSSTGLNLIADLILGGRPASRHEREKQAPLENHGIWQETFWLMLGSWWQCLAAATPITDGRSKRHLTTCLPGIYLRGRTVGSLPPAGRTGLTWIACRGAQWSPGSTWTTTWRQ